uniref:PolyA_pol domain-containing protein n=1 Tax=Panagrellus redivivus TaxID=6233 RepID=A0A7E4UNA1_PANRE
MAEKPGLQTSKLESEAFESLFSDELTNLSNLFENAGYELRMAGGAVRDLLMGIYPNDIDFASSATPSQMKEMFEQHKVRMLHKRGEEHGTITVRMNDTTNFEITTLRIDFVCDGRRAKVEYTTDWEKDAFRRDLTINSLFLGLDGTIYDYTGGVDDIQNRRVRFVGKPEDRIREDYLRILRYFRFFGRIGEPAEGHDADTLAAIIANREGMDTLSGERIWAEMKRIVGGRNGASVLRTMLLECGLGKHIGLPNVTEEILKEFSQVFETSVDHSDDEETSCAESMTLLSTLFRTDSDLSQFHRRNKVSNNEKALAQFIMRYREAAADEKNKDDKRFFFRLVTDQWHLYGSTDMEINKIRAIELLKYINSYNLIVDMQEWTVPKLPINGVNLMEAGVERGVKFKYMLQHMYILWRDSDYSLTLDELLTHIDDDIVIPDEKIPVLRGPNSKRRRLS